MFSKILKATICGVTAVAAGVALTSCANVNVTLTDYNRTFTDSNFTEIEADISWGEFKIIPSSDNNVYVDAKDVPDTFKSEIKNGVLYINYYVKSNFKIPKDSKTIVTVKIPEKSYNKLKLDLGSGITSIQKLDVNNNIDIDCGSGELRLTDIKSNGALDIDGGSGDINITNSNFSGLDAELGSGNFSLASVAIYGNIDINCGSGNVDISLINPASDFNGDNSKYKLEIDSGSGNTNISYNN